mgnify:CR=1 FL=1
MTSYKILALKWHKSFSVTDHRDKSKTADQSSKNADCKVSGYDEVYNLVTNSDLILPADQASYQKVNQASHVSPVYVVAFDACLEIPLNVQPKLLLVVKFVYL